MRCIAVCIEQWNPSDELFNSLVCLLDEDAGKRIRAFKFRHDALANLVGRLLPLWDSCGSDRQRAWSSIAQAREVKGRPYLIDAFGKEALDYDFNISHDGEAILMVSEKSPGALKLGVDVMRAALPTGIPSIPEFEETIADMLSSEEKKSIMLAPISEKLDLLLHFWTTKEAISKAMGEGLAFPYAELDSTPCRQTGSCLVRGATCFVKEHIVSLGSYRYMIAIAALGVRDKHELPREVEIIPVEKLVDDVLKLVDQTSPLIDL